MSRIPRQNANLEPMAAHTTAQPLLRALATNTTNSSAFASNPDTKDNPPAATASRASFQMRRGSALELIPFGTAAADKVFRMKVTRHKYGNVLDADGNKTGEAYVALEMCVLECTLCAKTGVSGGLISDTELYCDNISLISDRTLAPGVRIMQGSGDDQAASVLLDPLGADWITVEFTTNGVTAGTQATSANALQSTISSS